MIADKVNAFINNSGIFAILAAMFAGIGCTIAMVVGWWINLITVATTLMADAPLVMDGELLARVLGIFVAPMGAIMGLFF